MSLTYEHVLFNWASCEYIDTIQKIVNKGRYVNAKNENEKMFLHLTCENNHDGVI
jgi:ankyrin repeat protein